MFTWSEMPPRDAPIPPKRWVMFVVPLVVASILVALGHQTFGVVVGCMGVAIGVGTVTSKAFAKAFEGFAARLSMVLGALLRWLLLAPFYVVVMAPLALARRISSKDPLHLTVDKSQTSYWTKPPQSSGYDRPY
jgi:hypothetical protein